MTNDEIREFAHKLIYALYGDIDADERHDIVIAHIADAVTAAMEEAAKVADAKAAVRATQVLAAGASGDYAMESLAIARGCEAESIRDAIRALKPVTP